MTAGVKTEGGEELSCCAAGERSLSPWIWGSVLLFTLLYVSLIFNDNVWTDEIFSLNLFADSFGGILTETAADVHPPLYYFLGRLVRLLCGESVPVQKVLTLIPMSLTLILGAVKIRRYFGERTALWFILFLGSLPCAMQYAVQLRMYSWALLCVTACGLAAWEVWKEDTAGAWIRLVCWAVAAAYLHYFAFGSVIVINGLLFLALLCGGRRKGLVRWCLASACMIAAYLPWVPAMVSQVARVEAGYWIAPLTAETVAGYFTWAFGLKPLPQTTAVYLGISAAAGIGCLRGIRRDVGREKEEQRIRRREHSVYALLCMLVPVFTAAAGIVLSLVRQPIYRDQYVFPAMGLFCLFLAEGVDRLYLAAERRKGRACMGLLALFVAFTGAVTYRDTFREEYLSTLTRQTEAFFRENLGDGDLIVYNYAPYLFNYKYYFPEEKLSYVREVDLSQDFDRIWFLDTDMEYKFVPDQILPYDLQIEYMGHFGIEDNEFDLYRVTKGPGAAGRAMGPDGAPGQKAGTCAKAHRWEHGHEAEYNRAGL